MPSRSGPPFSRSYGGILPSSLTMIHSIALVFSTYPPESVWGTGGSNLARSFSWQHRITLLPANAVTIRSQAHVRCGFAYTSPYTLRRGQPSPRGGYLPASLHRLSTTCSGHALHTTSPSEEIDVSFKRLASQSSIWAVLRRYGNINPLSIDYACRPRLRSRLTQGRLA